jgi:hypothetical protein
LTIRPRAGEEHSWEYAPGAGHWSEHVDRHRGRYHVRIGIARRAEQPYHRRMVDQQLNLTELADQSLESGARLVGVADVLADRAELAKLSELRLKAGHQSSRASAICTGCTALTRAAALTACSWAPGCRGGDLSLRLIRPVMPAVRD